MATLDLTGSDHKIRMVTGDTSFTRKFDYLYQGRAVVCQETSPGVWSVSDYPGVATTVGGGDYATAKNDINAADFVFYGGATYEVTDGNLIAALTTEGYTI